MNGLFLLGVFLLVGLATLALVISNKYDEMEKAA